MGRVRKPAKLFYNWTPLNPSDRRAIMIAATEGKVRKRGALGSPADKDSRVAGLFAPRHVLRKLHSIGALESGVGFGTYVLTQNFQTNYLEQLREYAAQEEAWKADTARRKALAAERKAEREARKAQQAPT